MSEETKTCPCCPRGCDLSAPHCSRGEEYAKTGVIPKREDGGKNGNAGEHGHGHGYGHDHGHVHGHGHHH
jgi:hypothetical protein